MQPIPHRARQAHRDHPNLLLPLLPITNPMAANQQHEDLKSPKDTVQDTAAIVALAIHLVVDSMTTNEVVNVGMAMIVVNTITTEVNVATVIHLIEADMTLATTKVANARLVADRERVRADLIVIKMKP